MKKKEIEIFKDLKAKHQEEFNLFFFFFLKENLYSYEIIKSLPQDCFHTDFFVDFSEICKEELGGDFWCFWRDRIYSFDDVLYLISPLRYGNDAKRIVFYGRDYFFSKNNPLFKISFKIANAPTFSCEF